MGSPWTTGPGRKHKPANLLVVAATGALFLVGALKLADWLKDRDEAFTPPPQSEGVGVAPRPADALPDPDRWLVGGLRWSPPRRDDFGRSPAFLTVAKTTAGPDDVFLRILGPEYGPDAVRRAYEQGVSTAVAFRSQVTIGRMAGGGFLLRLPLDVEAARESRLQTEPGTITLAHQAPSGWTYVHWIFPEGLDLDYLPAKWKAGPSALEPLDVEAGRHLSPVMAFGGRGSGAGARTVLCRAEGKAGQAVEDVTRAMVARGWTPAHLTNPHGGEVRVLQRRGRQVWLATHDGAAEGGIVSVVFEVL